MEGLDLLHHIFIKDGAWLAIGKGIGVTAGISLLSLVLGTLLGAVLCYFRMGKQAILRLAAMGYIAAVRGAPVLMLLMLLFYGVFARTDLTPFAVAVLAFALHTAAHVAELLRSAILATDRGQVEAARTLGFSKMQAFRLVTLPQMVHIARPVYQSTIVNLIQWTSVVGYVTITDLTRVIYTIASRTMQPMVTLIGGMVIYIAMSYCVYGVFALMEWREKRGGDGQ